MVLHELTASFLVVCSASLATDGVKVGRLICGEEWWSFSVCVHVCACVRTHAHTCTHTACTVCSGVVAATTHTGPPGLVCVCGPS